MSIGCVKSAKDIAKKIRIRVIAQSFRCNITDY